MGCASSTPMVATAGSDMLKAATHVADDAKEKAENAVQDVSHTITDTIDTAKETVGTAVAGLTNELGLAFKDGSEALDEAKHKVLEGLHLESSNANAIADVEAEPSTSRAPTPTIDARPSETAADADSLKTCTPEPEIERALANITANEEESPPTPKPTLAELAQLSAEVIATGGTDGTSDAVANTADANAATTTEATTVVERWRSNSDEEGRRPSTTEWEKFADQLAHSRKFKPYESFVHNKNQFSVYQDYTTLRDKPGHYDGSFSDGNTLTSLSLSSLSSAHLTPANLTPASTRRNEREFAKLVACEQPSSVSRASSRLSNGGGRAFDYNPQRERVNLPITTTTVGNASSRIMGSTTTKRSSSWIKHEPVLEEREQHSPVRARRGSAGQTIVYAPVAINRTPVISHRVIRPESVLNTPPRSRSRASVHSIESINKKREIIAEGTPLRSVKMHAKTVLEAEELLAQAMPLATAASLTSLVPKDARNIKTLHDTPSKLIMAEARRANNAVTPKHSPSLPRTPAKLTRKGANSTAASTPKKNVTSRTQSRSSHSSTTSSGGVVIHSSFNTPSTLSLSPDHVAELEAALARLEGLRVSNNATHTCLAARSPNIVRRTSNSPGFLISAQTSPWVSRKDYNNKENKPSSFIADLSSITPMRRDKSPVSPYKLRERCEICYNKYVINE